MIRRIGYYYSRFGVRGVRRLVTAKLDKSNKLIEVVRPDIQFPFLLRMGTSDMPTFDQIFVKKEYEFAVQVPPQAIIDAGANIGLASIYFANRYPEATIIAIEPEASNYELLMKNTARYRNVIPLNAALWNKNEVINLVDPGLGKWGFMTQEATQQSESFGDVSHLVQGMTVDKIMDENGLNKVDILKIDIEGAEREVFSDTTRWLERVNSLIIELHERMKRGCDRSFYNGSNGFDDEWRQGENVYLSRKGYLQRNLPSLQ